MLSLFGEFGHINRFRYNFKKFLKGTPIQFNGKPLATWKLLLPIAIIIIIFNVALISASLINDLNKPPSSEEIAKKDYEKAKEKAQDLSKIVGQRTQVPSDEIPNVATIEDVTELENQEFFKQAKNGDKILIYEKAELIVLYRPSEDKVIDTAPVLYNQPTPAVAGTSSAEITTPNPTN